MTRTDFVNQASEEIQVGLDLGRDPKIVAENIAQLIEGSRKHLDYDNTAHRYEWEDMEGDN